VGQRVKKAETQMNIVNSGIRYELHYISQRPYSDYVESRIGLGQSGIRLGVVRPI